jgi:hypothetical protein
MTIERQFYELASSLIADGFLDATDAFLLPDVTTNSCPAHMVDKTG